MSSRKAGVIMHIYGIAGVVGLLITVLFLIKSGASWKEYALVASGWLAALMYALLLFQTISALDKATTQSHRDGEQIGSMEEQIRVLKKELKARSRTLDWVASQQMGQRATPRAIHSPETISEAQE